MGTGQGSQTPVTPALQIQRAAAFTGMYLHRKTHVHIVLKKKSFQNNMCETEKGNLVLLFTFRSSLRIICILWPNR